MSAREIKAGGAFVEVTVREGMGAGLARAQAKLAHFAHGVHMMSRALAGGLRAIGHGLEFVGVAVAAAGAGILAAMGKSVQTFLDVSEHAKKMGMAIAGIDPSKAERLSSAIETLKAVWGAIQFRVGQALAEPLIALLKVLIQVGAAVANFIKNNQRLVVIVAAVALVLFVAGTAVAAMGAMFILAAAAIAGVAHILVALATPVGLVVALAAALAAGILLAAGAFIVLAETSTGAVSGLLAAIANGNILKAWAIVTDGMTAMWKGVMFGIENSFFEVISRLAGAFNKFIQMVAADLRSIEKATGLSLGAGQLSAASGLATSAIQTGAKGAQSGAAFDMAGALAELAKLSADSRKELMARFAGVGVNIGDLGALTGNGGGARSGFGVTGSTNAQTAGMNRSMNGIEKEQKKTNEHLTRIIDVLKKMEVSGGLEFAP